MLHPHNVAYEILVLLDVAIVFTHKLHLTRCPTSFRSFCHDIFLFVETVCTDERLTSATRHHHHHRRPVSLYSTVCSLRGIIIISSHIACDLSHKDRMCSLSSARCTVLATRHHGSDETAINSHHHQVPSVSVPPVTPPQHGVLAARHHHSCIECGLSHKDRMCCLSSARCVRRVASLKEK